MTRRITAVAQFVGVSEATVSRVLNDRPGVAAHTREAVLSALDALGYERPSKLRGERGRLVGLVIPDLANPTYALLADTFGAMLNERSIATLLCPARSRGGGPSEEEGIDLLLAHRVSGVVFFGGAYQGEGLDHSMYQPLLERQLPGVLLNTCAADLPLPKVSCDDWVAGSLAMRHLLGLGHRRIGLLVGEPGHLPSRRRLEACRREAAAVGVEVPEELVLETHYTIESGRAQAGHLWRRGVTAIVCSSDMLAVGAIRAAERAGLSVPADVSVVGFDDSPLMEHTNPPLTTVRMPVTTLARAATELLVDQMEGREAISDEQLHDPELVLRASTGPARSSQDAHGMGHDAVHVTAGEPPQVLDA